MIYTLPEIKQKIKPIAMKYSLSSIYIFGSYARNEATENSDLDFLVDISNSKVKGWIIGELYNDLCDMFAKKIDIVTTYALTQEQYQEDDTPLFIENIEKERVALYESY